MPQQIGFKVTTKDNQTSDDSDEDKPQMRLEMEIALLNPQGYRTTLKLSGNYAATVRPGVVIDLERSEDNNIPKQAARAMLLQVVDMLDRGELDEYFQAPDAE